MQKWIWIFFTPAPFHCINRRNCTLTLNTIVTVTLTLNLTLTLTLNQTLILNLTLILTLKFKIGGMKVDILPGFVSYV